jgi:hypothetical protein
MQLGGLAGLTALTMGIGQDGAKDGKTPRITQDGEKDGNGHPAEPALLP